MIPERSPDGDGDGGDGDGGDEDDDEEKDDEDGVNLESSEDQPRPSQSSQL